MAVSNFTGNYNIDTYNNFIEILSNPLDQRVINNFSKELEVISEGKAKGKLVGGNLATLVATLGTKYDLDYREKILFLEDFKNCPPDSEKDMSLIEVFQDYFRDLKKPVIYNLESGHSEPMLTLPLGAMCGIDSYEKKITILEKVVK